MFYSGLHFRRFASFAPVAAIALALGGCISGSASPDAAATTPTPIPTPATKSFAATYGAVTSEGLATQANMGGKGAGSNFSLVSLDYTTSSDRRWFTSTTSTNPDAVGPTNQQKIQTTANGGATSQGVTGVIESDGGSVVRGGGSSAGLDYIYMTNTPSKALDSSLGVTNLAYSYIGMGSTGTSKDTGVGISADYTLFSFFGGQKTNDMPTTGTASYRGAFEGVEQSGYQGASALSNARISGVANMNADFKAKTVSGRIDDINRYTTSATSTTPSKSAADYSLGFSGAISGNSFSGKTTLNEWNSNALMTHTTQSGALQGGFFGPGAAEAAGALAVSADHDGRKSLVTGSFGAKKQ